METKTKDNGQAKVANTVQADKSPKFVAGNPVNKISEKEEPKSASDPIADQSGFVNVNKPAEQKGDATAKPEAKAQVTEQKSALNLEQTLKLVAELAKKTALRDKYTGYIDDLSAFVMPKMMRTIWQKIQPISKAVN